MENLDLMHQKSSNSQSLTHSRPAESGSRQTVQARPDHPNRMVSPSGDLPSNMQQVAPASNIDLFATRFNNKLPLFVLPVPDFLVIAVDALSLPWEDLDAYAFPPAAIPPLRKNHSDCSGVAQHALVLGPSDHVQSDPTEPALLAQPVNIVLQSDPSQKSDKPKSPCMAPRATSIKEQGFSETVAARI